MSPRFWLAAVVVGAGAVAAAARPALAGDAECSYLEIAATTAKEGSIDLELKALDKKLKKPPFSAWNTFKKLSSGTVVLTKSKPEMLKLKQGAATLLLRDRSAKRLELTVTMDNAQGMRVLETKTAFNAGDWQLFVVTDKKDDGHILALTCR